MPYILNKTNGSVVATVADGSINQTTDLTFVGKNFAGYGEIINENLLKLLENFSNRTAPAKAILGQLWFDSSTNRLKVRKGNFWNAFPYVEYSDTQPNTLIDGDLWFNSSNNKLYVKNSRELSGFTLIGPSISSSTGSSGSSSIVTVATVTDTDDIKQTVFTHTVNSEVVMVVSAESFNVKSTDPLYSTFKTIKKGITLSDADPSTGVSSPSGNFFYGTAAHALRLGNYTENDFLLKSYFDESINASSGFNVPTDDGVLVGVNNVFKFHADSGQQEGKITATAGTKISFNLRYPTASDDITNILTISGNKILPGSSVSVDLGANVTGNRFSNIYVDTVNSTNVFTGRITATTATFTTMSSGIVSGSFSGNLNGNVVATAVTATNVYGTVNGNVRTNIITAGSESSNGSITGRWTLVGSSTLQATYADIAERYHADAVYDAGTVLVVGGQFEVTTTRIRGNTAVAGVVSTDPAYMLNSDAGPDSTHPYIALKGRVPCKVIGKIKKGDMLVTAQEPGYATAYAHDVDDPNSILGRALEEFDGRAGGGLIEIKV